MLLYEIKGEEEILREQINEEILKRNTMYHVVACSWLASLLRTLVQRLKTCQIKLVFRWSLIQFKVNLLLLVFLCDLAQPLCLLHPLLHIVL